MALEQTPVADPAATDRRFAALPSTAAVIMAIDLARLRASEHFAAHYEHDLREWFGDLLGELTTECEIDPLTSIDHILVGSSDTSMADRVAVIRGLSPKVVTACLERVVAVGRAHGDPRRVVRFRGGLELTAPGAPAMRIGFFDERTLILARRKGVAASRAALARLIAAKVGGGASANADLMRVVDHARVASFAWSVVTLDGLKEGRLAPAGIRAALAVDAGAQLVGRYELFGVPHNVDALAIGEAETRAMLRNASLERDEHITAHAEPTVDGFVVHFQLPAVNLSTLIERVGQGKL